MKGYTVEKLKDGMWTETYMKHLEIGDIFRISRYLNHLNDMVPCTDACGYSEWTVTGKPYVHPIYDMWTTPAKSPMGRIEKFSALARRHPIKFVGGGHIVVEL